MRELTKREHTFIELHIEEVQVVKAFLQLILRRRDKRIDRIVAPFVCSHGVSAEYLEGRERETKG